MKFHCQICKRFYDVHGEEIEINEDYREVEELTAFPTVCLDCSERMEEE